MAVAAKILRDVCSLMARGVVPRAPQSTELDESIERSGFPKVDVADTETGGDVGWIAAGPLSGRDVHNRTFYSLRKRTGPIVTMSGSIANGPGALGIFDVPDPAMAAPICGIAASSGMVQNVKMERQLRQDDILSVRQNAT